MSEGLGQSGRALPVSVRPRVPDSDTERSSTRVLGTSALTSITDILRDCQNVREGPEAGFPETPFSA
jgi:hypothetical protein